MSGNGVYRDFAFWALPVTISNMSKMWLGIAGLATLAGLLYVCAPFVGCWYGQHRFNRYVHVQVDLPSCEEGPSQPRPCRYVFSFEGADTREAVQFAGADLHFSFNSETQTYTAEGIGKIINRGNVIDLGLTHVAFNSHNLPRGTQPNLVFVRSNGHLVSGYCDVSR